MRRILCTSHRLVSYRLMLGGIRAGAKQVEDERGRALHPKGHMGWPLEIRLGPNTHIRIIGGIEVKNRLTKHMNSFDGRHHQAK